MVIKIILLICFYFRLYQILLDKSSSEQLLVEAAVTVGSLARGSEQHVQELLSAGLLNVMLQGKIFIFF